MAKIVDRDLHDAVEIIDGNQYERCKFTRCRIIYRGGELPSLTTCSFHTCSWSFEDAAERTLTFLRAVYHGMDEGGRELVEETFRTLKVPYAPA